MKSAENKMVNKYFLSIAILVDQAKEVHWKSKNDSLKYPPWWNQLYWQGHPNISVFKALSHSVIVSKSNYLLSATIY